MKKIFIILPAILLLAAACGSQPDKQNSKTGEKPTATDVPKIKNTPEDQNKPKDPKPAFNMVKVALSAQNNSGESGSATIFDAEGKAKIILNITGQPAKVAQPAHIHFGSCSELGDVKYPLITLGNGASQTILPVSLTELVAQPFAINVHKSAAETSVYVACGDTLKMNKSISTDPEKEAK